VIGGVRYERFDVDFTSRDNPNSPFEASRVDDVWSPRVGAVVKPTNDFHVYASYAKSFLPQNGDNFGQLDVTGSTLEPEQFLNYETGFKWTVAPRLLVTGAVYQLDRENQRVVVANETLANGLTRTKGAEVEISGYVTDEWQVFGGYAYTESEILDAGDNTALVGNSVESVPLHSVSLWNKYQLNRMWGVGLGVIHQSSWFATAANTVKVPGYTRLDGAVFLDLDDNWSAQLNVENIFDNEYWISSHDNNNISYGAPRSAYVTVKATY
jgi:catecholate siderophore receptor